jgi:hypothetical protein
VREVTVGTNIWTFGLSGPAQGDFYAILNSSPTKHSAQTAENDYRHVLFEAHGLEDGQVHKLTFVNGDQEGRSFTWDYAIIQSGASDPQ